MPSTQTITQNPRTGLPTIVKFGQTLDGHFAVATFGEGFPRHYMDWDRQGPCSDTYFIHVADLSFCYRVAACPSGNIWSALSSHFDNLSLLNLDEVEGFLYGQGWTPPPVMKLSMFY